MEVYQTWCGATNKISCHCGNLFKYAHRSTNLHRLVHIMLISSVTIDYIWDWRDVEKHVDITILLIVKIYNLTLLHSFVGNVCRRDVIRVTRFRGDGLIHIMSPGVVDHVSLPSPQTRGADWRVSSAEIQLVQERPPDRAIAAHQDLVRERSHYPRHLQCSAFRQRRLRNEGNQWPGRDRLHNYSRNKT